MQSKGSELFFKDFLSDNGQPVYYQLYDSIRKAILEKRFKSGEKLPPTRSIARFCKISRSTVQTAFDLLMAEGYIYGEAGSGTYVNDDLPEKFITVPPVSSQESQKLKPGYPEFSFFGNMLMKSSFKNFIYEKIGPFQPGIPSLNDFPIEIWSRTITKSIKELNHKGMSYSDPQGLFKLREMIAIYLRQSRGVKCDANQIIIVNGSQQALTMVSNLFLGREDKIIMEDPVYSGALEAFKTSGAQMSFIPVDADGIDINMVIKNRMAAKLIYTTPSHQFPLGPTLTLNRRIQLLEWAAENSALIIEDDYDSEFRYTGNPLSSLQGMTVYDNVIYIGTFSKVLFPGLRIGYMVLPSSLFEVFSMAKALQDRNAPILEQLTLALFMEEGHFGRHLRKMRITYQERQQKLVSEFNAQLADFGYINPCHAGLHLIAYLNSAYQDKKISLLAADHNINVPALSNYCQNRKDLNGLLMGYAAFRPQELASSILKLKTILRDI